MYWFTPKGIPYPSTGIALAHLMHLLIFPPSLQSLHLHEVVRMHPESRLVAPFIDDDRHVGFGVEGQLPAHAEGPAFMPLC